MLMSLAIFFQSGKCISQILKIQEPVNTRYVRMWMLDLFEHTYVLVMCVPYADSEQTTYLPFWWGEAGAGGLQLCDMYLEASLSRVKPS